MDNKFIRYGAFYQSIFNYKKAPLSYKHFPYWYGVIDSPRFSDGIEQSRRKMIWMCSRQVGKSVNIAILATGLAIAYKNFTTIITQPTDVQIRRFSVDTLKEINKDSIVTNIFYYDPRLNERQVKNKSYTTGSRIVLANLYASVLSAHGIPADACIFDEYQNTPPNHADEIEYSLKRSPHRFILWSGNPAEEENDIQKKFDESTGAEWMVKCSHCDCYTGPLGLKNIGKNGLICEHCGKRIFAEDGRWVKARKDANIAGYRVNELMIPRNSPSATSWKSIKSDLRSKPMKTIMINLLGQSYSENVHPIKLKSIMNVCDPDRKYVKDVKEITEEMKRYSFAGIDWALEMNPERRKQNIKSYTMLTIGHYQPSTEKMVVDFIKRYNDIDYNNPDVVINDMLYWITAFHVRLTGMDYGAGHKENQRLVAELGYDSTMEFIYMGSLKDIITYDSITIKWEISKRHIVDDFVEAFTIDKYYQLAKYDGETSEYASDLTTVYKYNDLDKRYRRYGKIQADDWMHSLIYMRLACLFWLNKLQFISK